MPCTPARARDRWPGPQLTLLRERERFGLSVAPRFRFDPFDPPEGEARRKNRQKPVGVTRDRRAVGEGDQPKRQKSSRPTASLCVRRR